MTGSILIALINNAVLMFAMGLLFDMVNADTSKRKQTSIGFFLGIIGIAVMLNPLQFTSEIIFDTRSVLLSISGLFFGPFPTVIAMFLTSAFRIFQGGIGQWTGLAVIVTSGTIGILWRHFRNRKIKDISAPELYFMGIVVHIAMLIWMLTLPGNTAFNVLYSISLPVLLIYPIATVIFGHLLVNREKHIKIKKELLLSEQHLSQLLTVSPCVIYTLNPFNFELTWVSPNIYAFTGYTSKEALKPNWWKYHIHPDDKPQIIDNTPKIINEGNLTRQYRFLKKDSSFMWIQDEAQILLDENNQPAKIIGALTNINDLKETEEERTRLHHQLIESQKIESVGRLAGGIAHDFNNVLTVILNYSELALLDLNSPDELKEYLNEIKNAGQRSAEITNQLLAFSRKQTIAPKTLNLNNTIEQSLKMLQRLIGENIKLEWIAGAHIYSVKLDPSQLNQMLANLCVNARDAIDDTGKVTIKTENVSIDENDCQNNHELIAGDFVLLTVSDSGSGMDSETLENIFEPFYTTKEVGKGTGLGMATVYGIVRQNKGFIRVYSKIGAGTTFKIYLPKDNSKAEEEPMPDTLWENVPQGNGETILLVEDELALLDATSKILERLGYKVLTAKTPNQAVDLAASYEYNIDLLVTDIIMPEINGKELSEKIIKIFPGIKILFMSGYTANVIAPHGVLEKNVNFIQKPFSSSSLGIKIRAVLDM